MGQVVGERTMQMSDRISVGAPRTCSGDMYPAVPRAIPVPAGHQSEIDAPAILPPDFDPRSRFCRKALTQYGNAIGSGAQRGSGVESLPVSVWRTLTLAAGNSLSAESLTVPAIAPVSTCASRSCAHRRRACGFRSGIHARSAFVDHPEPHQPAHLLDRAHVVAVEDHAV
jgi:hypothetical protein